ncbi:MAG TPA: hypothetical protein VFE58_11140 [Tepidisphaeraceae bacterium]|jgi:hypothetical protein|nr:hypothetical protein [Tepidisphaeraceae bacterium]
MAYDIFISYSRRDNAHSRVTQLVDRIQANSLLWRNFALESAIGNVGKSASDVAIAAFIKRVEKWPKGCDTTLESATVADKSAADC